jgi:hypothetical protein
MKYILTILLTLFSFTLAAQDTSSVCIPYPVAKQISVDLVAGDSARDMLDATLDLLSLTEQKMSLMDSTISIYKKKELNLMEQVRNERMAKDAYITMYGDLEKENDRVNKQYKKQKFVNRIYKVGFWGGLAVGIVGYIILTK